MLTSLRCRDSVRTRWGCHGLSFPGPILFIRGRFDVANVQRPASALRGDRGSVRPRDRRHTRRRVLPRWRSRAPPLSPRRQMRNGEASRTRMAPSNSHRDGRRDLSFRTEATLWLSHWATVSSAAPSRSVIHLRPEALLQAVARPGRARACAWIRATRQPSPPSLPTYLEKPVHQQLLRHPIPS